MRAVETLSLDDYSEEKLVREFWARSEHFAGTLVSFNGRRFDIPVLELAALRYGIAAPFHFAEESLARERHSGERHLDLFDYLSNFGAIPLAGGMDLLLKMIGMPGKTGMDGSMVQEYFETGRLDEIHRYCRNDVVQTYFLFLRVALMRGEINAETYHAASEASLHFMLEEPAPRHQEDRVTEKPKISLIVISRDEEEHIAQCLRSAWFCDELILVDSFSTDRTVEIAQGARRQGLPA